MPRVASPSSVSLNARSLHSPFITALLLGILCFAVRVPLLTNSLPLPPDGHEYVNVAWNLAHGNGFRKTIKWNFYKPHPVVHSALGARPIFYSIVLTPLVAAVPQTSLPKALRILSALLCVGTVILAYLLWLRLYSPGIALAGGLILAVQPGFMDIGTLPLTEPLLLFLLALTFYTASRSRTWFGWGLVGLWIGLGYLTRPNGLFLLPIFFAWLLLQTKREEGGKRETSAHNSKLNPKSEHAQSKKSSPPLLPLLFSRRSSLFALIAGFLLAALPFWIANARVNGSPLASDLQLAYAVLDVKDATWNGFGRTYTRPFGFISTHLHAVMEAMQNQTWGMLQTFANSLPFLSTFIIFLRRKQIQGLSGVLILFGLVNLAFYCISWNVTGAVRYLLPTTFCLLGPLIAAVTTLDLPPLKIRHIVFSPIVLLLAIMVVWFQPSWQRLYKTRTVDNPGMSMSPMYRIGTDWLKSQHPSPDTVVASNNPWMVDFVTHLPTSVCPSFDSPERVREFVKEYRVRYIIMFGKLNVGRREEKLHAANLGQYHSLAPNVHVWEFSPSVWNSNRNTVSP